MACDSFDAAVVEINGEKVLFVSPAIPDGASPALKNALATRRIANVTGQCPDCNVTAVLPNRARRRAAARTGIALHVAFEHEAWCACLIDDEAEKT